MAANREYKDNGLVQELRGSLSSPAEFAAPGGKFPVFPGSYSKTEVFE
jgi:hypothetical protein